MISATSFTDTTFDEMLPCLQANFNWLVGQWGPYLFQVQTDEDLYQLYLDNLPEERQHHNCHCCRRFIEQYGSLAAVNDEGGLMSVMWLPDGPSFFRESFKAMARAVSRGKITGVAFFKEKMWGIPSAGGWSHFNVLPGPELVHKHAIQTPFQTAAEKKEDYKTLVRGLADFNRETLKQAATLLQAEALYRGEKVNGPIKFLLNLQDVRDNHKGKNRDNLTWKAVASAPPGFCHPRSTMIGTLLEDIAAGHSFETVKRRFDSKMNPLQYQRPQAAPTAGNIVQAEKLIASMGLESALKRRFAFLGELQTIWLPKVVQEPKDSGGIFGHLKPKGPAVNEPLNMAFLRITWEKFARTVLPEALKIQVQTQFNMNLCAILTAVDPEAPLLLQWDNPFSWYVYHNGSAPGNWNLSANAWVNVTGITLQPSMWAGENKYPHQGKSVILILEGCRDTNKTKSGLGLFPETLKTELHSIRATIEAYSRSKEPEGRDEASACGLRIGQGVSQGSNNIRVTTSLGTANYLVDRWD